MFRLITEYETLPTRDRRVVAGTGDAAGHRPLWPQDGRSLVEGEWLEYDDDWNLRRGGDNNDATADVAARPQYCFWLEEGRYDAQAINGGMGHVLLPSFYEFETDVYDDTGLDLDTNNALTVIDFDLAGAGVIRRVLADQVGAGAGLVVARLTHIDAVHGRIRGIVGVPS